MKLPEWAAPLVGPAEPPFPLDLNQDTEIPLTEEEARFVQMASAAVNGLCDIERAYKVDSELLLQSLRSRATRPHKDDANPGIVGDAVYPVLLVLTFAVLARRIHDEVLALIGEDGFSN